MSSEEKTVSIVFTSRPDRASIPATGAFGGPTPDGNAIVAHLYVEHGTVPNVMTHRIDTQGRVDFSSGDPVKRGDVTREIQATLLMSPEHALSFGSWLVQHAQNALSRRKK